MPTRIAEYYNELQRRESLDPVELVAEWAQADTDAISGAFRKAFAASRITEQTIPIRAGSTNQSIGNQVADFFVPVINQHLQQYRMTLVLVVVIRTRSSSKSLRAGLSPVN